MPNLRQLVLVLCCAAGRAAAYSSPHYVSFGGQLYDRDGAQLIGAQLHPDHQSCATALPQPAELEPNNATKRARDRLSWLLSPLTADHFLQHHWEQRHHHVSRDKGGYYDSLLSIDDIDAAMQYRRLVRRETHKIDKPATGASREPNNLSNLYETGWEGYLDGGALTLEHFEKDHIPLARLCQLLQPLFYFVRANLYLSAASQQTFLVHADAGDLFAVQVAGVKRWTLYDTSRTFRWPLHQHLQYGSLDREALGPPVAVIDLKPGEVLYVPRGMAHEVETLGTNSSVHFTISLATGKLNWAELLQHWSKVTRRQHAGDFWELLLQRDSAQAIRRALPPGLFAHPQGSDDVNQAERVWQCVSRLLPPVDAQAASSRVAFLGTLQAVHQNLHSYHREKVEALAELRKAPVRQGLRMQTLLIKLVDLQVYNDTARGGLRVGPSRWRVCERLSPMLLWVVSVHREFQVSELPGHDLFGKLALVRHLMELEVVKFSRAI